jgi:hypothetical protein
MFVHLVHLVHGRSVHSSSDARNDILLPTVIHAVAETSLTHRNDNRLPGLRPALIRKPGGDLIEPLWSFTRRGPPKGRICL